MKRTTISALVTLGLGMIFGYSCLFGGIWSRGTKDVYSFEYGQKSGVLKKVDMVWGPDRYYFLINGKDELLGALTTDGGKQISIYNSWRKENSNYSIKESPLQQ